MFLYPHGSDNNVLSTELGNFDRTQVPGPELYPGTPQKYLYLSHQLDKLQIVPRYFNRLIDPRNSKLCAECLLSKRFQFRSRLTTRPRSIFNIALLANRCVDVADIIGIGSYDL